MRQLDQLLVNVGGLVCTYEIATEFMQRPRSDMDTQQLTSQNNLGKLQFNLEELNPVS